MGSAPPPLSWSLPHFSHQWKPSPLQAHWGRWRHSCLLRPACLFTVHMGSALLPLPGAVCHTLATAASFPLSKHTGGGGASQASVFIYSSVREYPSPILWSSGCPALFATSFFSQLLVYYSVCFFLFFSCVGVSLSRGLC
jgi:hypothetical protein